MGTIGDCHDNSMMESFRATLQLEVLDSRIWETRTELANAIFEWIECWYNTERRHSSIGMLRPVEYETRYHHLHGGERFRGADRVVAGSLGAQQARVGGEADLPQRGQIGQPFPIPKSRVSLIVFSVRNVRPSLWYCVIAVCL
ncbi:MAG: integrase core domain-containing protein [Pseudonocardiaceae bacterium]